MAKLAINGGRPEARELIAMAPSVLLPRASEKDKISVLGVLESGYWCRVEASLAKRSKLDEFEQKFAAYQDAKFGVSACNGTVALQLALRSLGVGLADEVVVDANAFIASASAVTEIGAVPVLTDVDPETGNISPSRFEQAITEKTKAVIVVHCAGYPANLDEILPIAKRNNVFVVEDAATSVGSQWKGRKVGAIGDAGTFSFQQRKILTAGEGGMVLTDDEEVARKAKLLHNIGRIVGRPGYVYEVLSSNYRMTEFQAALLLSRLDDVPDAVKTKHSNGEYLRDKIERVGGLKSQKHDSRVYHNYYALLLKYSPDEFGGVTRERLLEALIAEGVPVELGYGRVLYRQPAFSKENLKIVYPKSGHLPDYHESSFPYAEEYASQTIQISHHWLSLDRNALDLIASSFEKVKSNVDELVAATPPRL